MTSLLITLSISPCKIITTEMGQAYCITLCGERPEVDAVNINAMMNSAADEPREVFAKRVKQHIQIHPKIKQIYLNYRTIHPAQRKGIKLQLYYLFSFCAYYQGQWKNGLPHGFGRVIYDDGSIYEGCFNNGIAQCDLALFIRKDGSFYRGQIRNNKANGDGQLSTTKFFFKGRWLNDLPNGMARQIYNTHSFYEGEFVNGAKQGEGYYRWNPDEYYVGRFQNNKLQGKGKLQTKNYIYQGQFKSNKKEGFGQYIDKKEKFKYFGEFSDNFPFGKGRITYQDSTVFSGQFDGFQNRKGTIYLPTGEAVQVNTQDLNCDLNDSGKLEQTLENNHKVTIA